MTVRLPASPLPDTGQDTPPGPDKRAARQQRILEAAIICFARDGFHGTSMQKICAEAEMSPGALYRYFPSKESIIAAIVQGERTERLKIFMEVIQHPNIIMGLVETLARMLREPSLPTACLGPEIMAEAIRNTALRDTIEAEEESTRELLGETLSMAVNRGEIDPDLDISDVIMLLQIMADGTVLHHQLHPEWKLPERMPVLGRLINRMFAPPSQNNPAPAEKA